MKSPQCNSGLCFMQGQEKFLTEPRQIIRLEARSNYTRVYFNDHPPVLMAKVLRAYDKLLRPYGFVRTHRSHLINPQFVTALDQQGAIRMQDASKVEVSRRKRRAVFTAFSKQDSK